MKNLRWALVVFALVACKKDSSTGSDQSLPPDLRPKPVVTDTSKLKAPALFAYIPADTPYIVAGFEAVPLDYYAKMKQALGPTFGKTLDMMRAIDHDGKPSVLDAIVTELDGKWNAAGLESLGLSATPRFALYGLGGVLPAVLRFEVKDDKAVLATIDRIAKKAGESLPAMATRDGRNYWRIPSSKLDVIVSLADNQLVVAVGPAATIDAKLPQILGLEKPAQNMADGKALADVMTRNGFGPNLVGFIDTKRFATQLLAFHGVPASAECSAEIDRVSTSMPRITFGYSELSTKRGSGGVVVELSPDAIKQLEALKAEVPGLAAAVADEPLMAFGGGLDIAGAQKLGVSIAQTLKRAGDACQAGPIADAGENMRVALMRPLPEFFAKLHGGVMVVHSVTFGGRQRHSPMPDSMDAFGLVSSSDAKSFVEEAMKLVPPLRQLGLEIDGKLHKLGGGMLPIPFDVYAGVGDKAVVFGVGDKGRRLADKTIDASGGGKVPFLVLTYDYGKFLELRTQMMPDLLDDDSEPRDLGQKMNDELSKMFGRAAVSIDVTDKGLAMWGSVELK